eukprot:1188256-Prorocentrum_minimum.AAC.2
MIFNYWRPMQQALGRTASGVLFTILNREFWPRSQQAKVEKKSADRLATKSPSGYPPFSPTHIATRIIWHTIVPYCGDRTLARRKRIRPHPSARDFESARQCARLAHLASVQGASSNNVRAIFG